MLKLVIVRFFNSFAIEICNDIIEYLESRDIFQLNTCCGRYCLRRSMILRRDTCNVGPFREPDICL